MTYHLSPFAILKNSSVKDKITQFDLFQCEYNFQASRRDIQAGEPREATVEKGITIILYTSRNVNGMKMKVEHGYEGRDRDVISP